MKKLSLSLETLAVESFATDTTADERGTVHANGPTITVVCGTCYVSCNLTACPADC